MKLFLTSSTITPNLIKPFENLIGKSITGLKCIFIPDAAYGVRPITNIDWIEEERQYLIDNFAWNITDLILKNLSEVTTEMFENIDVIFVNGGFSGYLAKEMRRTSFDKVLTKVLEHNVIYVGSSAGSMVCSKTQKAAEWYINEPEEGAGKIPGLGLIDFEIYPHFTENLLKPIEHLWKKGKLYLLKDGEAICVQDVTVTVLGTVRVLEK